MVVGVWIQRMGLAAGVLLLFSGMGEAIDVDLDPATVKKAVENGKQMKDVKTIPTRFGADLDDFPHRRLLLVDAVHRVAPAIEHEQLAERRLLEAARLADAPAELGRDGAQ